MNESWKQTKALHNSLINKMTLVLYCKDQKPIINRILIDIKIL